jgi:two-component system, NarL family, nitrate/nitrite response regulator NarL
MPDTRCATIRVLVVDDHALFRESVARLLAAEPGFEVAGHCSSIDEGLAMLTTRDVDIVLLDFDLGARTGAEFPLLARRAGFAGRILVVTAGLARRDATRLVHDGVSGIFMKHDSADMLAQSIRNVMDGQVWFDERLLQETADAAVPPGAPSRAAPFTERERRVLGYVFEGLANKEIADRISVSESSVKATLQQLFAKTGVRTRSQLVRVVLEQYKDQF